MATPTLASIRDAAQEIAKRGELLPHQLAAFSALDHALTDAQRQQFTDDWRAKGSPAAAPPAAGPPAWPAGTVGPKKQPDLRPGDHHLIANDVNEMLTAWSHDGKRLWRIPCLCRGQGGEAEWGSTGSDTPPGLYLAGRIYRDYEQDPSPTYSADRRAYGWFSIDLEGQEGQEGPSSTPYRDGIMMHGGGSACGWPGAWAPRQPLYPTFGCIRLHNADLRDRILPLMGMGRLWISVLQESP